MLKMKVNSATTQPEMEENNESETKEDKGESQRKE